MYSGRVYPNYLSGTGYVMSRDIVPRLYKAALKTPLFHLEDVYLTGLCAHAAGIRPRFHPAFSYTKRKLDPCLYKDKTVITSHHVNSSELRKVSKNNIMLKIFSDFWNLILNLFFYAILSDSVLFGPDNVFKIIFLNTSSKN